MTDQPLASTTSTAFPAVLLPEAEDGDLARRAAAVADTLAGYAGSARLDGRFRLAVKGLAAAVCGLEGMRAVGFAPDLAEAALPRLSELVAQVERAVEEAQPALERERQAAAAAAPAPTRRGRRGPTPARK